MPLKKPNRDARRPVDEIVEARERGKFAGDDAQHAPRQRSKDLTAKPRGPPDRKLAISLAATADPDAYTIEEFCLRHRLSVALFYKFRGEMPAMFSVGSRRLISREAAAKWRAEREREAASAAEAAA